MVDAATYPYVIRPGETNNSWNNFDESSQPIDYFTFNGGWWSDSWSWMYTAASPGQTLTFTFEGDAVALYARYYSGGSRFDVYLDGVKQASVDTNGNSGKRRVFSKSGLPVGVHVLEIKVTGTGGAVALEGFEYDYISAEPPETTGVETVRSGESVLIPARLGKYTFEGKMKVLKSYVPDIKKVESEIMQEVVTVG
ncbi:hypothetical protein PACILC2_33630 [Paenibacillus cisolokensis]|uniref:Uncharacterized protein n=2 Tax=Paenibacillus TaxID=44249 RepID=A0ABQ4N9D4_9BACL|nr:hypothetical protein PACILC2_33630 [Paenibacillus cisolokensis]